MKILLIFLLFLLVRSGYSQTDSTYVKPSEDRRIVGIVKIYFDGRTYDIEPTYSDTSQFKTPVEMYNIVVEAYVSTFPFVYPQEMFELFRENVEKFFQIYKLE